MDDALSRIYMTEWLGSAEDKLEKDLMEDDKNLKITLYDDEGQF